MKKLMGTLRNKNDQAPFPNHATSPSGDVAAKKSLQYQSP